MDVEKIRRIHDAQRALRAEVLGEWAADDAIWFRVTGRRPPYPLELAVEVERQVEG